jgi:hypothetical protein
MKKKPLWKIEREIQILDRVSIALAVVCLLIAAFALGVSVGFDNIEAHEKYGLYAGLTDINWDEYEVVVEEEATETVEESLEEYLGWTNEDYERMAHLVYAEGGSQGYDCMLYIGSVVLNRIESDRYPNTIKDVVNQKGQYSVKNWYMNRTPSEEAYEVVEELLTNGSVLPDYVLYQRYQRAVRGTTEYARINGEVFSY